MKALAAVCLSVIALAMADAGSAEAVPPPDTVLGMTPVDRPREPAGLRYARRDEHSHMHSHAAPLTQLNETLILMWHKPTPPSYAVHDFEDPDVDNKHPGLMAVHALLMGLAFFIALPAGIALRSVHHAWHGFAVIIFYALVALGVSTSALYAKLTPDMYEGSKHGSHGYFVILIAVVLTAVDALTFVRRAVSFVRAVRAGEQKFGVKALWKAVVIARGEDEDASVWGYTADEYTGLVHDDSDEVDVHELKAANLESHRISQLQLVEEDDVHSGTARWAKNNGSHQGHTRGHSIASDGTLFHPHPRHQSSHDTRHSDETLHEIVTQHLLSPQSSYSNLLRMGQIAFAVSERLLVFLGYGEFLTGIVVYTGVCRDSYVNGCLAHLIKGGIFWCYGLVTFARFLGSFSELGWAWNRPSARPGSHAPRTAEFVESFVIFLYGITNTWMERFGVTPGTPYSTKEVQHIGIAVMFWFAGLVGMGMESKHVRSWLQSSAMSSSSSRPSSPEPATEPATSGVSFNPFPALVIGVTGAAMAAHAQVYLFQVQIHSLWGALLVGFAVLRCLTYFFLWLGPPSSILPSRPPTEALASFALACGGLMFQMSTEELTLAAMRRGHDDQMMFLNVAVAVTCLAFCWTLAVVAFKGWLRSHSIPASSPAYP